MPAAKRSSRSPSHKPASRKPAARKPAARGNSCKPCKPHHPAPFERKRTPDAALSAIVGKAPLTQPHAVRKFWLYVKKHKLQSPCDGRVIKPDAALSKVFGRLPFAMTKVSAGLYKHMTA